MASRADFILRSSYRVIRRATVARHAEDVLSEYIPAWTSLGTILASATTIDQWLTIEGFDARTDWFNVDGRLSYQHYNSSNFYRNALIRALNENFGGFQSITEYGCGIGRNLLFLKRVYPHIRCYGYELVPEAVDLAKAAARKFGFDVEYAQLDYVRDPPEKFKFPNTDVAFTMFSLEQLPQGCDIALANMLARVTKGTIHLEPVVEHYPNGPRGFIGRIDHRKAGYLRGFTAALRDQRLSQIKHARMDSSHNPLMFPSVYVLMK